MTLDRDRILKTVRENAEAQVSRQHLENYLRACEAHGGLLEEVAQQVRRELSA